MKKIKTCKHSLKFLNKEKQKLLSSFLQHQRDAVKFYVSYIWNNEIKYEIKGNEIVFDIKSDKLNCPKFLKTTDITYETQLSARALASAITQACSIVSASVEKRRRLLFIRDELKSQNKRTRAINNAIDKNPLVFPNLNTVNLELNSLICNLEKANHCKSFDYFVVLSSLYNKENRIKKLYLPIKDTKQHQKLLKYNKAADKNSFLFSDGGIDIRVEYEPIIKKQGEIRGADTGINDVINLSDKQKSVADIHGHSLNSILHKIVQSKKGSKGFERAISHRDNFINWSINQLNLTNIKQINLEKVSNFRHNKNVGGFLNYSGEALIRNKLIDFAEDHGVRVNLQGSAYRSQRCSHCGYVNSKNRKAKLFSCKSCSFQADADYNASLNHEQNLPCANFLLALKVRLKEFFWKENGFFDLSNQELIVPDSKKK